MKETNQSQTDEISLFELFEIIWSKKFLIIAITISALFCGFGYIKWAKPEYKVSSAYKIYIYPGILQKACARQIPCVREELVSGLMRHLNSNRLNSNGSWQNKKDKSYLFAVTENPKEASEYLIDLESAKQSLISDMYTQALFELDWLQKSSINTTQKSDTVAAAMIDAKRVIMQTETEQDLITFEDVSIEILSPKVHFVMSFCFVLGVALGVFVAFTATRVGRNNRQLGKP